MGNCGKCKPPSGGGALVYFTPAFQAPQCVRQSDGKGQCEGPGFKGDECKDGTECRKTCATGLTITVNGKTGNKTDFRKLLQTQGETQCQSRQKCDTVYLGVVDPSDGSVATGTFVCS